jgi:hypothetical protein
MRALTRSQQLGLLLFLTLLVVLAIARLIQG